MREQQDNMQFSVCLDSHSALAFLMIETAVLMSVNDPQELAAAPRATSLVFVSTRVSRVSRLWLQVSLMKCNVLIWQQ